MEELKKQKDEAYRERNMLVATLSKLYPSHLFRHDNDPAWDREWLWGVCIHLPTKPMLLPTGNSISQHAQARWHIHSTERNKLFKHLKWKQKCKWDGHTTEQKYEMLLSLPSKNQVKAK